MCRTTVPVAACRNTRGKPCRVIAARPRRRRACWTGYCRNRKGTAAARAEPSPTTATVHCGRSSPLDLRSAAGLMEPAPCSWHRPPWPVRRAPQSLRCHATPAAQMSRTLRALESDTSRVVTCGQPSARRATCKTPSWSYYAPPSTGESPKSHPPPQPAPTAAASGTRYPASTSRRTARCRPLVAGSIPHLLLRTVPSAAVGPHAPADSRRPPCRAAASACAATETAQTIRASATRYRCSPRCSSDPHHRRPVALGDGARVAQREHHKGGQRSTRPGEHLRHRGVREKVERQVWPDLEQKERGDTAQQSQVGELAASTGHRQALRHPRGKAKRSSAEPGASPSHPSGCHLRPASRWRRHRRSGLETSDEAESTPALPPPSGPPTALGAHPRPALSLPDELLHLKQSNPRFPHSRRRCLSCFDACHLLHPSRSDAVPTTTTTSRNAGCAHVPQRWGSDESDVQWASGYGA
eukprot:ctg_1122.g372